MRRLASLVSFILLLSVAAEASCGSASCPLNNHRYLGAGVFLLSLSREYINQDLIYVGSRRSFVGAIPYDHNEVQTINERNVIQFQVGLTDRLGNNADIPFVSRQHSHILTVQ